MILKSLRHQVRFECRCHKIHNLKSVTSFMNAPSLACRHVYCHKITFNEKPWRRCCWYYCQSSRDESRNNLIPRERINQKMLSFYVSLFFFLFPSQRRQNCGDKFVSWRKRDKSDLFRKVFVARKVEVSTFTFISPCWMEWYGKKCSIQVCFCQWFPTWVCRNSGMLSVKAKRAFALNRRLLSKS